MREIKFRAWDKLEKSMVTKCDYCISFDGNCWLYEENPILKPGDIEIMQYTGVKDKNDKEIYEGDIVVYANWPPKAVESSEKGVTTFVLANTNYWLTTYDQERYEVVGNIYENPELLGDTNE